MVRGVGEGIEIMKAKYEGNGTGKYTVIKTEMITGVLVCGCGAVCDDPKDRKRFLRRHPVKCSERRAFAKELAAGTRSVDSEARHPEENKVVVPAHVRAAMGKESAWAAADKAMDNLTDADWPDDPKPEYPNSKPHLAMQEADGVLDIVETVRKTHVRVSLAKVDLNTYRGKEDGK